MLKERGIAVPAIMHQLHLVLPRAVRNKPLGDAGFAAMVPALCDMVSYDQRFKLLGLHLMALTEASASGLASVLACNNNLETLQLGGNKLGDAGASVVAAAAAASSSLCVLELSRNKLTAAGIQTVIGHFKASKGLLAGAQQPGGGHRSHNEGQREERGGGGEGRRRHTLTKLDLSGNPGSKAPEVRLAVSELLLQRATATAAATAVRDSRNCSGEKGTAAVVVESTVLTNRYCDAVELQAAGLVVVL